MAFSSGAAGYSAMGGPSPGHTRVSYRRAPNFLERLGGSMCGSVVGLGLIAAACILLFLNEGRSVHTYNMLVETRQNCNPVKSPDSVYAELDNRLVYLSGKLATSGPVSDPDFGVSGNFARLKRRVEMYQWVEETETREFKEPDGSVRQERQYRYSTAWRTDVIHSRSFDDPRHHHNPGSMPLGSMEWTADQTTVGRYELSQEAVAEIDNFQTLHPSPDTTNARSGVTVYGEMVYSGNPHRPEVGDIRVSYTSAGRAEEGRPDTVSVVARQSPGPLLTPFTASDGSRILFLYTEQLSMDEVFGREHASNEAMTWLLRGLGWLLVVVGCNMVAGIFTTLVDWVPLLREAVSLGMFLLCLALGSSLSLVVIAVAWLRYHPLYGLAILAAAASPCLLPKFFSRKNQPQKGS
jgi:hypothetical protein